MKQGNEESKNIKKDLIAEEIVKEVIGMVDLWCANA